MEGICGLFSFDHTIADSALKINKMLDNLSDGEPLDITLAANSHWAVASAGWQKDNWKPMTYSFQDDSLALVAIGDIYNFHDLARETRTDPAAKGEILATLFRSDPNRWTERLRGNFAIIVFDIQKQTITAAIDRFGIRPLCWLKRGNTIYMASRLNSIKAVCPDLEINPSAIYAFIQHEMIPAPMTIYKSVNKMEAGFKLVAQPNYFALERYWDITASPKFASPVENLAQMIYENLDSAVNIMTNGLAEPNEVGSFLSGGTDSSSISGLMSKSQNNPVDAYSIGFPENGYDEMNYARIAAKAFSLNHHEFYVQPDDVLAALPTLARSYDEPFGNSSIIPAYFCALEAKKDGINYMLAGDGGDEVFGGNERYSTQQVFRNYLKAPIVLRKGVLEPLILNRMERLPGVFRKAGSYIRRANMPDIDRIFSYKYVSDAEIFEQTFLDRSIIDPVVDIPRQHFNRMYDADALDRHLYLDMKMTITDNDLVKVTHMTELAGVRVRYPMLDAPVVEHAFRIPSELKLRHTTQLRYIFKQAFRDFLPREILSKPKHGFGLPIAEWLRNNSDIKQFAHDLLFDSRHLNRGYFQPDFIKNLWNLQLADSTPYYGTLLWKFIMLESWHRLHIENDTL